MERSLINVRRVGGALSAGTATHRHRGDCAVLFFLLAVAMGLCWILTQGLGLDGRLTYMRAGWHYNASAKFDNTFGTWGTDYGLAVLTSWQAWRIFRAVPPSVLRLRAMALLGLYAASTAFGGAVHRNFRGTNETLNTISFRVAWTVVVITTLVMGSAMWLVGNELLRLRRSTSMHNSEVVDKPLLHMANRMTCALFLPDKYWLLWGVLLSAAAVCGGFSYIRPACDIFIAGASQTLPTFYLQLAVLSWHGDMPLRAWWCFQLGLMGNVPLIFMYPWLVQHSGLSLGMINAMCHSILALSWGLQGFGLEGICRACAALSLSPPHLQPAAASGRKGLADENLRRCHDGSESNTSTASTASTVGSVVAQHRRTS